MYFAKRITLQGGQVQSKTARVSRIGNSKAFSTARVRPPRAPLLHAPGRALFSPRHREPPAAPAHETRRWPALSAAGRRPGSAGQDGLLVTGSGRPGAARGRTAGCGREGLGQTLWHTRMMLPKGGVKLYSSCSMDAKKGMARCGGVTHTGPSRTHWGSWQATGRPALSTGRERGI